MPLEVLATSIRQGKINKKHIEWEEIKPALFAEDIISYIISRESQRIYKKSPKTERQVQQVYRNEINAQANDNLGILTTNYGNQN